MSKNTIASILFVVACGVGTIAIFVASLTGGQHLSQFGGAKTCILVLQKSADAYALDNKEYPSSWKELLPYFPGGGRHRGGAPGEIPLNPLRNNPKQPDYLFDLPSPIIDELLTGNVSSLSRFMEAGRITYGASTDKKRFAIVGFENQDHDAAPLAGKYRVLVITNGGKLVPVAAK